MRFRDRPGWRALLGVLLVLHLTGCTSYRTAVLPGATPPPDEDPLPRLERHQAARITLVSGDVVEGDVREVGADHVTLGRVGNYGLEETRIAAQDIARMEASHTTQLTRTVAAVAAVTFVVLVVTVISFGTSMRNAGGLS